MEFGIRKMVVVWLVGSISLPAFAQSGANRPWEEYSKHITARTTIAELSNGLFHEKIDLYTGRLSFRHVDIDIPGNSALPVTLARTYRIQDPIAAPAFAQADLPAHDLPLVDWELDVPRLSGVFAHKLIGPMLGPDGLIISPGQAHAWSNQRCSGLRVPPIVGEFFPGEYWHGLSADMPGGGEMLEPAPGAQSPSAGGPYRWVTTGFTWFSCLPSIKNGTGEGFLAVTADGTKYWFDWMAGYHEPTLYTSFLHIYQSATEYWETVYEQHLMRKRNVLYATRVEDRYGNWVTYHYSNAASTPARLDRIESNDGRKISIAYNAGGNVSSASDGTRTWSYRYAQGTRRLEKVTLPDNSEWRFELQGLISRLAISDGDRASCSYPGVVLEGDWITSNNAKLSMTHPSGAVGEYEIGPRLHGRSNVPKVCNAIHGETLLGFPEVGTYSDYVRMYWTNSLVRKRITGSGLPAMQWDYHYHGSHKPNEVSSSQAYNPPGSWAPGPYTYARLPDNGKPITDISTYIIADPVCVSDSCAGTVYTDVSGPAGEWERHTFGNSYRYNEHKLLKVERGTGVGTVLSAERTSHELARSGQPFPAQVGFSRQYKGDSITESYIRPLRSKEVVQGGILFKSVVNSFDAFGRPLSITKSSTPTP